MSTDRRERDARDEGMSLVEVLVASGLFVVLTTLIASVAILGMRTSSGMQIRLDNSVQGGLGMAATSKLLRTAVLPDQLDDQSCDGCADTAIVQATATRVTFYANLDNTGQGPSLATLEVVRDPWANDGSAILRQTLIAPTPTTSGRYRFCNPATEPTCKPAVRTLARGLIWPSPVIFAFYDFGGLPITGPTLVAADLPRVSSADVTLTVQTAKDRSAYPTTTIVQRVRMPNADINVLVETP